MKEEELIKELRRLNIRQAQIIEQLHELPRNKPSTLDTELKPGDTVILLTKGVRSNKGDRGTTTRVTNKRVHIKLTPTGHHVTRKKKNVKKLL